MTINYASNRNKSLNTTKRALWVFTIILLTLAVYQGIAKQNEIKISLER